MSVAALTSPSLFSPVSSLASNTSAQAAFFSAADDESDDPAAVNNLTGSSTASIASQTMQALLDMTQSDPSAAASQSQQNPQGAQGGHHHHHHGGHGAPQQASATATNPADSATQDASTAPPRILIRARMPGPARFPLRDKRYFALRATWRSRMRAPFLLRARSVTACSRSAITPTSGWVSSRTLVAV